MNKNTEQTNSDDTKKLLNINQVAEIFGVHPDTLRRWDREGKLKSIRIGKRGHRKYSYEDIQKTMKQDY